MTIGLQEPSGLRLPPALPGGLPLLGHFLDFHRDLVGFLLRARQRLGEIFSFSFAGHRIAFFSGPRAHEAFFRAPEDQLSTRFAYRFTVPLFGPGVGYGTSEAHRNEQIAMILPAMNERRLRGYAGFIQDEIAGYLEGWGDEGVFDLLQVVNDLTLFIASRCLIGREFRRNVSAAFTRLYRDLVNAFTLFASFLPNLPLRVFRRRDRARRQLGELLGQFIADRRRRGVVEEDFLQTLLTARFKDGSAFPDEAIAGFLVGLVFAGQHTSALLAAWSGFELLRRPDYVQKVIQEQEEVMRDGSLTLEALREMVVLERAVQEAERLHPPRLLIRKVLRDFSYGNYLIPAGWLALVSPAVSHLLPEIFQDASRYDPERFSPGREEHRKTHSAIISFGGGMHACIGKTFAYLQIKTIWSELLRRFELRLLAPNARPYRSPFVDIPRSPCRISYRRRRPNRLATGP